MVVISILMPLVLTYWKNREIYQKKEMFSPWKEHMIHF